MNLQIVIAKTFSDTFFSSLIAAIRESLRQNGMDPNECEMYDIDSETVGICHRGSPLLKRHKPDIKMLPTGMIVRSRISSVTN